MNPLLNEERLVDEAGVVAAFADDADDAWDDDDSNFDDVDFDGVDEGAFDDLSDSDWPRAAVDACAPEGAFDA